MRKRTHEQFVKEVLEVVGYEKYEFLTEYQSCDKKITIRCKEDNYTWTINANGFLKNGCHCPKCSNKVMNKDTDYFKNELKELYGDNYICLGEYTSAKNKILLKHNTEDCQYEFEMTPDGMLHKKNGCPKCGNRKGADKLFISHEEFCARTSKLFDNEFEILSLYKGRKENVTVKHIPCGRVYDRQAGDVLQGKGCRFCGFGATKDTQWFKEKIFQAYQGEYEVLGEYVSSHTTILIRHNKCGKEYKVRPDSILKGARCTCEATSKGEKVIEIFLRYNKIKFKQQYTYPDCKNKKRFPFDVAIKSKEGNVMFLIEYDGIQHYEPKRGEIQFKKTQFNDGVKTKYCKDNNIPLLRIAYWDFNNINYILVKYFDILGIKTSIPTDNLNIWEEGNQFKLIKLLKELPNGIYTKRYLIDMLDSSTVVASLTEILNIDCVKEICSSINVKFTNSALVILNNYVDYEKYNKILISINLKQRTKCMNMFYYITKNIQKIKDKCNNKEIFEGNKCYKDIDKNSYGFIFLQEYLSTNNMIFEKSNIFISKTN